MDSLRRVLNGREEEGDEESQLFGNVTGGGDSCCPSLSWETRIKGFIACCGLGILLSIIGSITLFFGNLVSFALLYSFGTLTALSSTLFLRGPVSQMKSMFKETRIFATIIMLLMVVLTLCSAFWWKNAGLCLLFCILQFVAFAWYSISYIPFARDAVKKCFSACLS
uniref:vesicle transport protein SFT2B isoform X1 n=1 Tax=Ciona intestinalis TaxID=7719 RepID=UPI000180D111|nr:vesicle transport protein SFT2B isoform X1 [Ciona intestinalis]|eukprot:XP_002132003.1 vesicle transport protein SFT2B isoform X1 [Ciona intestinalis]